MITFTNFADNKLLGCSTVVSATRAEFCYINPFLFALLFVLQLYIVLLHGRIL